MILSISIKSKTPLSDTVTAQTTRPNNRLAVLYRKYLSPFKNRGMTATEKSNGKAAFSKIYFYILLLKWDAIAFSKPFRRYFKHHFF